MTQHGEERAVPGAYAQEDRARLPWHAPRLAVVAIEENTLLNTGPNYDGVAGTS